MLSLVCIGYCRYLDLNVIKRFEAHFPNLIKLYMPFALTLSTDMFFETE